MANELKSKAVPAYLPADVTADVLSLPQRVVWTVISLLGVIAVCAVIVAWVVVDNARHVDEMRSSVGLTKAILVKEFVDGNPSDTDGDSGPR